MNACSADVVDSAELASSLSVLCGGTSDEKARAVFALYNFDGDGVISLEAMVRYLASVFKIMYAYHAEPETAYQMDVSAKDLTAATAEQAFEEADLDDDGNQTFEEFQKWYKDPAPTADESAVEDLVPEWVSLAEVRRLTNLEAFELDDIVDRFSNVATEDRTMGPLDFNELMIDMALMDRAIMSEDQDKLRVVLVKIFFF